MVTNSYLVAKLNLEARLYLVANSKMVANSKQVLIKRQVSWINTDYENKVVKWNKKQFFYWHFISSYRVIWYNIQIID